MVAEKRLAGRKGAQTSNSISAGQYLQGNTSATQTAYKFVLTAFSLPKFKSST